MKTMKTRFRKSIDVGLAFVFAASIQTVAAAEERSSRFFLQEGEHFSRTFDVGPSGSLDLSNVSGDIEVRGGEGNAIRIEAEKHGHGDPSLVTIEVSQTGNRVRVETKYSKSKKHKHVSVDFDVTVPWGTSVSATSVSGDVTVDGVRGELEAESVSGEVTVSNAENLLTATSVSGDVTVESAASLEDPEIGSVSGDVQVEGLKAPEVEVSSVSGDVILTSANCERASLESVSGDIRYSGTFAKGGRYEFQSHSGDVQIYMANDVGFELAAETFSGDIESEFPLTMSGTFSKREIRGVYGDGSVVIEASTFSGSVTISKQ
jgi:DUF4097 and DUF4098 domain-containing protein YvlB